MNIRASNQTQPEHGDQKSDVVPESTRLIDQVYIELEKKLFLIEKENYRLKEEIKRHAAIEKELMERHNSLHFIANHDPLTGLPNRRSLMAHLDTLLSARKVGRRHLAVGFMDLDNFKSINDKFGHAAGDLVLLETAERLKSSSDSNLVVGRLAGDEFLIIVKQINDKAKTIERIKAILERVEKPITLAQTEVQISASLGIACYPDPATGLRSLLMLADQAMYQAKSYRGRSSFVSNSLNQKADNSDICRRANRRSSIKFSSNLEEIKSKN